SSYGALPFVKDAEVVFAEVARVVRPGGQWVFSTTHPMRWMFPDVPGEAGLTVEYSYFDRTPYVELSSAGQPVYAAPHRTMSDYAGHHGTMSDWSGLLVGAGFTIESVTEPEWPESTHTAWGGWSPLRGALMPGTVIFSTTLHED